MTNSTANVSGGINLNANDVSIGGDAVGRDKIVKTATAADAGMANCTTSPSLHPVIVSSCAASLAERPNVSN